MSLLVPVLPLRDVVVYPHMVVPLFVGRGKSIQALDFALQETRQVLLVSQQEAIEESPKPQDLYKIGTLATILQMLKLPDGTLKVLVEGNTRARIVEFESLDPFFLAKVDILETQFDQGYAWGAELRSLRTQFENFAKLDKKFSPDVLTGLAGIDDPVKLVDTIAAHMPLKIADKQTILEIENFQQRCEKLMALIQLTIELLLEEKKINDKVKQQIEKKHREYYLTEKIHAIQKELGDLNSDAANNAEIAGLLEKIAKVGLSAEAKEKVLLEINKLKMMPPLSAEATVSRNYVDWILSLPWSKATKLRTDLMVAQNILNKDHYGLEKVKERIVEHLAVLQRVKKMNGPILCLVGPPGTGKTSIARSIARSSKRKFMRISLGGVRDESEIRGHRRTYIGALPGKILQKMAKAKVTNPLILLDEIDKMAMDYRGDPASALLEVLDTEQNKTFNDHYLEVDYDLSNVMFVTTANSLNIPAPLLDRLEVITLAGYTEDEKMHIATQYLIPKQMKDAGLKKNEFSVSDDALLDIIRYYTRESGVRNLEREFAKLCRKVVKSVLVDKMQLPIIITRDKLEGYLGVPRYRFGMMEESDQVGQAMGLAWTESGGDTITVEAVMVPGKGKITCTGKLGDVMQESIQTAMTVVRNGANRLGIENDFYEKYDIHIHLPEGATPKDGPSAGIAVCVALVSMLTQIPVRKDVAMTGEITLRGQILPIGGLKEKLLAARRAGINDVIIPEENCRELKEIAPEVYKGLNIHPVRCIDEVINLSLLTAPKPLVPVRLTTDPNQKKFDETPDMLV